MLVIQILLVAVLMAVRAAECCGGVRGMTFNACVPLILIFVLDTPVNRKTRGCVHIMHRPEWRGGRPGRLRMTLHAIMAEIHRLVIGRRDRSGIVALVTLIAIGVCQRVIAIDVTVHARQCAMRADQWEIRVRM